MHTSWTNAWQPIDGDKGRSEQVGRHPVWLLLINHHPMTYAWHPLTSTMLKAHTTANGKSIASNCKLQTLSWCWGNSPASFV